MSSVHPLAALLTGHFEAIMERAKEVLERSGVEEASGATSQDLAER